MSRSTTGRSRQPAARTQKRSVRNPQRTTRKPQRRVDQPALQQAKAHIEDFTGYIARQRPKVLQLLAFVLSFGMFGLIQDINIRLVIVLTFGNVLLWLLLDVFRAFTTTAGKIEEKVIGYEPPTYMDFNEARKPLLDSITDVLRQGRTLHLQVLSVAGSFSWRDLIQREMRHWLQLLHPGQKIIITYTLVHPDVLVRRHLYTWNGELGHTLASIEQFKTDYKVQLAAGLIELRVHHYDNLPMWHGLLINRAVLFLGTTCWDNQAQFPSLDIGQAEYQRFALGDQAHGDKVIGRFENWFEYYEGRDAELP